MRPGCANILYKVYAECGSPIRHTSFCEPATCDVNCGGYDKLSLKVNHLVYWNTTISNKEVIEMKRFQLSGWPSGLRRQT